MHDGWIRLGAFFEFFQSQLGIVILQKCDILWAVKIEKFGENEEEAESQKPSPGSLSLPSGWCLSGFIKLHPYCSQGRLQCQNRKTQSFLQYTVEKRAIKDKEGSKRGE